MTRRTPQVTTTSFNNRDPHRSGYTTVRKQGTMFKERVRRIAVGGGILALALAGIVGTQSAATATDYELPPGDTGSLTINKHERAEGSTPGNPAGPGLEGIGFAIQSIGTGSPCVALDLTTMAGWESASALVDAFTVGDQSLPAGYCLAGSAINVTTGPGGTVTQTGLKGLYWVTETSPGGHMITDPADPFIVAVPMPVPGDPTSWDFSVEAYPKNETGTFTPSKTVNGENVGNAVTVGAIVPWEISTPIPVASFPYHTIVVTDNVGANHVFDEWGEVSLNGTLLNGPDDPGADDYTIAGNVLTLTAAGLAKVNAIVTGATAAPATLVTKLTTEITGNDVVGARPNTATVTLNGQTGTTPTPVSNWGKLVINKHVVGNTQATLEGARFAVYVETAAGCAVDVTGTPVWETPASPDPSDSTQSVLLWISNTMPGDPVGTKDYCLVETKAPTGHILDTTPREVTISSDNDWITTLAFPNTPVDGPELPLTGSTGTMAFALVGFGLIGSAGVLFAVRRARSLKQQ